MGCILALLCKFQWMDQMSIGASTKIYSSRFFMTGVSLINIGSCGLHQVHAAFQNGGGASGWGLDNFLSSCYWLFKDTPARQEDCSKCTGTTVLPMKFCKHRWVENVTVTECAVNLIQDLKKYITPVDCSRWVCQSQDKKFWSCQDCFEKIHSLLLSYTLCCL